MINVYTSTFCLLTICLFFSCANCDKYIIQYEEQKLFYHELAYDEIGFRNRCTGYKFKQEPKDVINEYLPRLLSIQEDYHIYVNYLFDIKNKNLLQLKVKDKIGNLPVELVAETEVIFFKNLEVKYYNTFLNPIKKNIRGERRTVSGWMNIEKKAGELSVY